ncbi:sulfatase-like hydrolase/transferase [Flavobacterium faecale]|uniref:sulfatase-like hydrolase/transferase n=1 Tax=Flavobacterium faecale TaxID=1355330 RepID=UPI000D52E524|nr:sulfatase-like hydrolase/transferase [Flavobacterium faecale]
MIKKFVTLAVVFHSMLSISAQQRPNIIFVLTDDQSYELMGSSGRNNIIQTPNLDKMAQDGILFTNAHVSTAICTPSRVCILLSQYERKHGVNFNSGTSVSDKAWESSYPVVMRANGYYTGWIGKNHSPIGQGGYSSGLIEKSFDYWYSNHTHVGFYPKEISDIYNDAIAFTQPEIINEGVNDFLDPNERKLKGAVHFITNRPADKPFMLSINFNLPHGSSTREMKSKSTDDAIYRTLYRDLDIPLPPNYVARADIKNPKLPKDLWHADDRQEGYNYVDKPDTARERAIREMQAVTGIDRMVGNLRKKLQDLKIDKNTIIIFTSDHGLFGGEFGLGGKATCYEKNTHIPFIVYDPTAPKKAHGVVSDALIQTVDIAPTMLAMAGIKIPTTFQGKDISAIIKGDLKDIRSYSYSENLWSTTFGNPRCESIQDKRWKYIRYYKNDNFSAVKLIKYGKEMGISQKEMLYNLHDPEMALYRDYIDSPLNGEEPVYEELYDLKNDPFEAKNLIKENIPPAILDNLKKQWKIAITNARGQGKPEVYRYTDDVFPGGSKE